ncbi:sensor histidine kinase [Larkinella sp. VNQ87]|uniref:sensor histidine kinase n=1 Tax=Larkinella sp. VNQ87 TaxID=3400921 RepID=UPI003C08ADC2
MKIKFNKYVEIFFLVVALWGVIIRHWVLPQFTWVTQWLLFALSFFLLNVIWIFHYLYNEWLNRRFPFERNIRLRVAVQIFGGWGVVKTIILVTGYLIVTYLLPAANQSIDPELFPWMNASVKYISPQNLTPINRFTIAIVTFITFLANTVICLGFITTHFLKRWQENAVRAAELEKEKVQVQLDSLKNQISPHFLFNSLSSLDGLIHENPDLASQFLHQLSKVFRYVIQHKDKELVSLTTEVEFINNYISLLKTRFNGSLDIRIAIPPDVAEKAIVPVTLQILIENAIKHNVANAGQPLVIQVIADDAYVTVENNLQKKPRVETSNGQGLTNLNALYHFLSEKEVKVKVLEGRFQVSVPLVDAK